MPSLLCSVSQSAHEVLYDTRTCGLLLYFTLITLPAQMGERSYVQGHRGNPSLRTDQPICQDKERLLQLNYG